MNARAAAVSELEARLGRAFHDHRRLDRALTHASAGDGAGLAGGDNERLEFLGDRVLGLLAAEHLVASDPTATEGDLAPRLNTLVSRAACARVARRMGLGAALRMSGGETRAGGREKDSILAGACEAVIAAVYEDGGLDAARVLFRRFWDEEIERLIAPRPKDAKTRLQEWAQVGGGALPTYCVTARSGPEHAPSFVVQVEVAGLAPAVGSGSSRQAAEKAAAEALLNREDIV